VCGGGVSVTWRLVERREAAEDPNGKAVTRFDSIFHRLYGRAPSLAQVRNTRRQTVTKRKRREGIVRQDKVNDV